MAPNHKLTHLIKGRSVVEIAHNDDKTIVTFADGSTLRVKTPSAVSARRESWLDKILLAFVNESSAENTAIADDKGVVKAVTQNDTTLVLEFEDGSQMEIALAEAESSVMLRAGDDTMEYAD